MSGMMNGTMSGSEVAVSPVVEDATAAMAAHPEYSDHEKIFHITDKVSGLKARIFIHSLVDGRALGGCRRWAYDSDSAWSADGLRLSRGMTRKSAVAGLPLGGAKAAINHPAPTKLMMRAFGRAIAIIERDYGMIYITAEDVGITEELLVEARKETPNVRGITPVQDGIVELSGGDPGPYTAYGVFTGMKTALRHRMGKDSFEGVRVAVQGLGDVGYYLCDFLHKAGAQLFVADLDEARLRRAVEEFDAVAVEPSGIKEMDVDIFAPCAMGGALDETIRAPIVAGSANNQQKDEQANTESKMLAEKEILYAPDYVINAGGLISVYYEGMPRHEVMTMIERQVDMALDRIFSTAKGDDQDTASVADALALVMQREKADLPDTTAGRAAA